MPTLKELETEIALSADFKDYDEAAWEAKSQAIQVATKPTDNLALLRDQMVAKIGRMREQLTGNWSGMLHPSVDGVTLKTSEEMLAEINDSLQQNIAKQKRLMECLACTLKEIALRDAGTVRERIVRSTYYIDNTNGIDTAAGTKQGNFTADAGTNTTTIVDTELNGLAITDNAASSGDYVWNVTRGLGSYVDSWTDATDTIVLTAAIAGQTTGDTYYIISAWKTIAAYTNSARTAGGGDTGYLRANQTWTLAADIDFLTDGGIDAYHNLVGCDDTASGVDPWVDNSDIKPIVTFAGVDKHFNVNADYFWNFDNIQITGGTQMCFQVGSSNFVKFENCIFHGAGIWGLTLTYTEFLVENCSFYDNTTYSISTNHCNGMIKNSTFNGGAGGTSYAILSTGDVCYLDNCTFGVTTAHATKDLYVNDSNGIYARNCTWTSSPVFTFPNTAYGGGLYSEDDDATFESHVTDFYMGKITRATATPRGGGADSYAVMVPNANCGVVAPLRLGNKMSGFSRVWCTKDVEINVAVYARVGTAWDGALTAAQCYAKFSYLSNAATAARTEVQSTETISNVADWTTGVKTFTSGNITPLQTGWVYIWFYVAHWEDAAEEVWVDIKPVIS